MQKGEVVWFDDKKGFGFISKPEGGPDIFVHHSNIEMEGRRTLDQGDQVEYEVAYRDGKPQAVKVKKLN